MKKYWLIILTIFVTACSPEHKILSAETVDFEWPFSETFGYNEGYVECRSPMQALFVSNGVTFALNGMADARADKNGYISVLGILKDDPVIPGAKVNIGPMIELALKEC